MDKMKLLPIKVPWMLSPSYDVRRYEISKSNVVLLALCMKNKKQSFLELENLKKMYNDVVPEEIQNGVGYFNVRLTFENVTYFGILQMQDDTSELDEKNYDSSAIDQYYNGYKNFDKYWNDTEVCPDPSIYEIENSYLKKQLNITNEAIKHWLICGHDEQIHILSKNFCWEVVHNEKYYL